jgi:two-component system NtrC family sensor kinase
VKRPAGLRTQLLFGLVLIIVVATVSVGAITAGTTRWQIAEVQITSGRILGQALGRVLAPLLQQERRSELERVVRTVAGLGMMRGLDVVSRQMVLLASNRRRGGANRIDDPDLLQAIRTGQQQIRFTDDDPELMVVSSPVDAGGPVLGALRLELHVGTQQARWPLLFWALMGVDGLLLLLFVAYVLTRYVVQPVERVQQAALRVTGGDFATRVEPAGAREFASLAESFNTMTAHLGHQLERLERQRGELASSREQVIRSEKLASVGRLAAGVAHEVGNPLQAIIGFTELLLRGGLDAERTEDYLRRVQNESQRIHRIVRELLDFARRVDDAIEPVRLSAVVAQALQLVGPQRKLKTVDVRQSGLEDLPEVAGNSQRLVQVLVNLLLNAADAMEGSGTLEIRGSQIEARSVVELRLTNSGRPIPPEDRDRIFDPFFTTKEPGEGTGLGLSVAQSIVESYGGRLALADEPTTTFVIELQRHPQERDAAGDDPRDR